MPELIGNEFQNQLFVTEGVTHVDGREGRDTLHVRLFPPNFAQPVGPRTYVITSDRISDDSGQLDFTYENIEEVRFWVANAAMVTIDASAYAPLDPEDHYLSITATGGTSRITGSAFDDFFEVDGADNLINGGEGRDGVSLGVSGTAERYVIANEAGIATVHAANGNTTVLSLLRTENVEFVTLRLTGSGAGVTQFVVDASASLTAVNFNESFVDDVFIGSSFDDLFYVGSGTSGHDDVFTGGGGADRFAFGPSLVSLGNATITDLRPGDLIDLSTGGLPTFGIATAFIGTADFGGRAGEYRYFTQGGQTFVQIDLQGFGQATATLTIANGEFELEQSGPDVFSHILRIAGYISGNDGDNTLTGTEGADRLFGNTGNDAIDGGSNVDTAFVSGNRADYTVNQTSTGTFIVTGTDGTDTLTNIEFLQFDDRTIRLLRGDGVTVNFETADPAVYQSAMNAIRDFDGNALGGNGAWLRIGSADVNGDGDIDQILVNDAIGRFATVGTAPDGLTYFADHSWAGETRVAGIYIDPLVESGDVVAGSGNDSQRRFQNDLEIENINRVLGADDYDDDGIWEVYFALTDGTAYLRALMHADGNIRYANYQSQQEVIDYLTANGYDDSTFGDWFPASQIAAPASEPEAKGPPAPVHLLEGRWGGDGVMIAPLEDWQPEVFG